MSVLYPRLLNRAADELFTTFTDVEPSHLARLSRTKHPGAVFAATGGRRVEEQELAALRELVLDLAISAGFPASLSRASGREFDRRLAQLLHGRMGLVAAEASVRSVWAFLALVLLPDVAAWRFPARPRDRVLATDITRHVFGRLWWRAYLLVDPTDDDAYALVGTFGEAAFDQIFARRRSLGGSRELIRALARVWPVAEFGPHAERLVLRETLKRLLRHGAFQEFESLSDDDATAEIADVVEETVAALSAH